MHARLQMRTLTKELEQRLTVFENFILRHSYGPVRDKVRGEWGLYHNQGHRVVAAGATVGRARSPYGPLSHGMLEGPPAARRLVGHIKDEKLNVVGALLRANKLLRKL